MENQEYYKVDNIITPQMCDPESDMSTNEESNHNQQTNSKGKIREKLEKAGKVALSAGKAVAGIVSSIPMVVTPGAIAGFVLSTIDEVLEFGENVKRVLAKKTNEQNLEPAMEM